MRRSKKRLGFALASPVLIGLAGCVQSTEVPLAKVAPVSVSPERAKLKPPAGSNFSPPHIEGHN